MLRRTNEMSQRLSAKARIDLVTRDTAETMVHICRAPGDCQSFSGLRRSSLKSALEIFVRGVVALVFFCTRTCREKLTFDVEAWLYKYN